ncbi:hypothetical protein MHU86_9876 [Fragilaria crotonensis]|nr:hypothetical protein MHU86_9876 [Fragilaria crotonensis]
MGRGNKIAHNASLFVVVIVTAFISHVVTLSMMPPVGTMSVPDHMITYHKLTLRGRPRNKTVVSTKPPTLSAVAQLLAGISTDKPLVPIARTLPAKKVADPVVKTDPIPLTSASSVGSQLSIGSSKTKTNHPKSVGPGSQRKKSISSSSKPIDDKVQADSPVLPLTKKNDSPSDAKRSQQRKSISLWGKPRDKNLIANATTTKSPPEKVKLTPSHVAAVNSTQKTLVLTQAAPKQQDKARLEMKVAALGESKWIDNNWHPPPGGTLTLLRVLQAKGPDLSTVFMKRLKIKPCTTDDSLAACADYHGVSLDYAVVNCFMEMRHLILNRNVSKYTVVVVDFGQQEMLDNCPFVISNKQKMFVDVSQRIQALPTHVAWTTLAWADPEAVDINHKVMDSFKKWCQ